LLIKEDAVISYMKIDDDTHVDMLSIGWLFFWKI